MKKRILKLLTIALSLALIMVILPVASFKTSAYTYGPFTYDIVDGEAVITKIDNNVNGILELPKAIGAFPIKKIAENATLGSMIYQIQFSGNKADRDNIIIESGNNLLLYVPWNYIDTTGQYIYQVEFSSVTITGVNYADNNLVIPATIEGLPVTYITSLNKNGSCNNVESVTIPSTVTGLGYSAFSGFSSLVDVDIPEGVVNLGGYLFSGCLNLKTVHLPGTVTNINDGFLSSCDIDTVTVSPLNSNYYSVDNCVIDKTTHTLIAGCKNSIIPTDGSVTSIANMAFSGCINLSNIALPDSITTIGYSAFSACYNLAGVYYTGSYEQRQNINISFDNNCLTNAVWRYNYIPGTPFNDVLHSDYYYYYVKNGCATIYDVDDTISGDIVLPDSLGHYPVTTIDKGAFYDCDAITDITVPTGVTEIVYTAFENCSSLKSISIPSTVNMVEAGAFIGCSALEQIKLDPMNETYHVDGNCLIKTSEKVLIAGTKESVIPSDGSVSSIVYFAFGGCSGLKNIEIPNTVQSIGSGAFADCNNLKNIKISNGVSSIGEWAFSGCTSLKNITLPDSVVDMSGKVFSGCTSLKSVKLTKNIFDVREEMFKDCTSLTDILLPNNILTVGSFAFENCSSLKTVIIPDNVYLIGGFAFKNCTALSKIILPKFINQINDNAFADCLSLTDVYYGGTEDNRLCIDIRIENEPLIGADWHYSFAGHISGDINGDITANNKDLIRLLKYFSGWDVAVNEKALDINGDSNVNGKDLLRLLKYLSNYQVIVY